MVQNAAHSTAVMQERRKGMGEIDSIIVQLINHRSLAKRKSMALIRHALS